MTAPGKSAEAALLAAIRRRVELADAGEGWRIGFAGDVRVILSDDGAELFQACRGASSIDHELAANAPSDLAFLLALVDRAAAKTRELRDALTAFRNANPLPGEVKGANRNYAAEAAIKVQDLHFRQFLRWHPDAQPVGGASGDRDPQEIATDRLRAILGIASRKQLNTEPGPASRWLELRDEWDRFRAMPEAVRAAQYPGYGGEMLAGFADASNEPAGEALKGGGQRK